MDTQEIKSLVILLMIALDLTILGFIGRCLPWRRFGLRLVTLHNEEAALESPPYQPAAADHRIASR